MKFGKHKLVVAFSAILGFGMAGQASADVYGLGYINIDNLLVVANGSVSGGATLFSFSANQDAILDNGVDPTSGAASCNGLFPSPGSCSLPAPTLSGTVQNAPPASDGVRAENDAATQFGQNGTYSNAEAKVVDAVLTGDADTNVESISESNLGSNGGNSAQANTNILSNTTLTLAFANGVGGLSVSFTAIIDAQADVTNGDIGQAGASTGSTLRLTRQNPGAPASVIASWAPLGAGGGVDFACNADLGISCATNQTGPSLNNTVTSSGGLDRVSGSGRYQIDISGLVNGTYNLILVTNTSTDLVRIPVPGTLLMVGTGLVLGARATQRRKGRKA